MTPAGHGRCLRHEQYDLDCDDFEQLRARAGDRCEMPGCGVRGEETKTGILFIDHHGQMWVPDVFVRGLLCCGCNNGLGRFESGHPHRKRVEPTEAQLAYLARPFSLEPYAVASRIRKAALRKRRQELIAELDKFERRKPSAFDGIGATMAVGQILGAGARQADIQRGTPMPQCRISKHVSLWRAAHGA